MHRGHRPGHHSYLNVLHHVAGRVQQHDLTSFLFLVVDIRFGERGTRTGENYDFGAQISRGGSETEKLGRRKVWIDNPYAVFGRADKLANEGCRFFLVAMQPLLPEAFGGQCALTVVLPLAQSRWNAISARGFAYYLLRNPLADLNVERESALAG